MHPYADPGYVETLAPEGGRISGVTAWGNCMVVRPIVPDSFDAAGSYPLTPFAIQPDLDAGLEHLRAQRLVSVVMVPDPLASPPVDTLKRHFDHVKPFKSHLTIDPRTGYDPSKHHRERIRRGLRRCRIERGPLKARLAEWTELYAGLVAHRGITGAANFRAANFTRLAELPDVEAFTAFIGDEPGGMTLWFAHNGVVYNHLTACNAAGYANGAAFALYDAAIDHFRSEGIINLGGGAGTSGSDDGGLFAFKQGFANGSVTAHVCGAVLDTEAYAALSQDKVTDFFPAYRG